MGEMADWNIENGEEMYQRHRIGECDCWCQYCHEEENNELQKKTTEEENS